MESLRGELEGEGVLERPLPPAALIGEFPKSEESGE